MGVKVRERPKGSGVFWIFIDHNNRRKAKKIGTDEKLANEVAEKIQARLTLGDLDLLNEAENSTPDFEEYANCWLEDYIKPLRRNTTYERYGDLLKRYVYPMLIHRYLN